MRHRLTGLAEDGDGGEVAGPGRVLDVVGTHGRRDAGARERLGAPLVCDQPPASRCGLVHRATHEGMPEAKASRDVRRPDQIELQQVVDGDDRDVLRRAGSGGSQLGLEGIARDRSPLENRARAVGEQPELLGQCRGDAVWNVDARERDRSARGRPRRRAIQRASELLEVEGVAAARLVQAVDVEPLCRAEQLAGLVAGEFPELDTVERPCPVGALDGCGEPLRDLARPDGERRQHRSCGRPVQQGAEQLDGRGVGPVEVVEDEDERLRAREELEQLPDGAVASIPLVLDPRAGSVAERRQRREHLSELTPDVVVEPAEPARLEALQVLVERVDEHPERQVTLELGGRARQHKQATLVHPGRQLCEEACLADSRLPDELDRRGVAGLELREEEVEGAELFGASDEMPGNSDRRCTPSRA